MAKQEEIYFTHPNSPVLPDKFDVRVRLRHLTRGALTFDDVKKHLAALPDDAAFADFRDYDAVVKEDVDTSIDPDLTH